MESPNQDMEVELWRSFIYEKSHAARDKLIARHMPLAQYLASVIYKSRVDDDVAYEDYLQYANLGLIEAIDNYDLSRNVPFSSYANFRIKGSIFSGLSKFTEKREQIATRKRLEKERVDSIASSDSYSFQEFVDATLGLAISFILSDESLATHHNFIAEDQPYQQENLSRLGKDIQRMLKLLNESERLVISRHYFEYVKFVDIADTLGVSKGRVSQIHKTAIEKLRIYISANSLDDVL